MKLPIRYFGDPMLRQKCKPVKEITEEIKQLTHDMIETFDSNKGIGISACQVGVPIRIFVLRNYIPLPDGTWTMSAPIVYINPKIISASDETEQDTEGCLSIPGVREWVERPIKLVIEATDLNGNRFTETFEGKDEVERLNARVRMHENDHLNGVLFIDRLPPKVRKRLEGKLHEIKQKYSKK